jgi:hypothetical protein
MASKEKPQSKPQPEATMSASKADVVAINIPDRKPYEGKASRKQKSFIWEMGYRDTNVIDNLGKVQASAVIEQLLSHHKDRNATFAQKRAVFFGSIILLICLISWYCTKDAAISFAMGCLAIGSGFVVLIAGLILLVKHMLAN